MAISRTRNHINNALGLLLLGALAYIVWPFATGGSSTREFCATLKPGMAASDVGRAASAAGYQVTDLSRGHGFVHSGSTFGRSTCELRFGSSGLESAQFNSAD